MNSIEDHHSHFGKHILCSVGSRSGGQEEYIPPLGVRCTLPVGRRSGSIPERGPNQHGADPLGGPMNVVFVDGGLGLVPE